MSIEGSGAPVPTPAFRAGVDRLGEDVEELVRRTREQLAAQVDSYAVVPRSAIVTSVRMNLDAVRDSLLAARAVFTDRDAAALERRVDERVAQGLRVEDAIRGYRVSIGIIYERFVELATAEGVEPAELLVAGRVLWQLGDVMAGRLTVMYQQRGLDDALRESHLRSDYLAELLAGRLTDEEAAARGAAFGLDLRTAYRAVQAGSVAGSSLEPLRRRLEARPGDLVGVGGRYCVGIVTATDVELEPDDVVAFGPVAHDPKGLAKSYATATRLHDWMSRRGLRGRRLLEDVGWRLAVDRDDVVSTLLLERYRDPLAGLGEFGALVWASVRAYVEADRHIARAAARLTVHQNTLRHRLARFADVTGADLESTDVLLEVRWALDADSADGPDGSDRTSL